MNPKTKSETQNPSSEPKDQSPTGADELTLPALVVPPSGTVTGPTSGAETVNWPELLALRSNLPVELLHKLRDDDRLRFDAGVFILPVRDTAGAEVGTYRCVFDTDPWRYAPEGKRPRPLVLGDPAAATTAVIAATPGDMLAAMSLLGWRDGFCSAMVFITVTGEPVSMFKGVVLPEVLEVVALSFFKEELGKWASALSRALPRKDIHMIRPPIGQTDFAAWLRAGMTPEKFVPLLAEMRPSPWNIPGAEVDRQEQERSARVKEIRDWLDFISADNPDDQLTVGRALHSAEEELGVEAETLWIEWRKSARKFDQQEADLAWERFESEKKAAGAGEELKVGLDDLLDLAKARGWTPIVLLPPHCGPHIVFAAKMGELLADTGTVFQHGREPVQVAHTESAPALQPIVPAKASTLFEQVARLRILTKEGMALGLWPEKNSKITIYADPFLRALPEIRIVTNCPVLVERDDGTLDIVQGFDEEAMVYAGGVPVEEVAFDEAVILITSLANDFLFETPGDKARFIAAFVTPALVAGGLLGSSGRPPMEVTFGDRSQSGKGYRNKLITATFNSRAITLNVRKQGVGGLDEGIDAALRTGASFIAIDNIRGQLDSQKLESMLTEDRILLRSAYTPNLAIDPTRTTVLLTSNGADLTTDALNRSSIVRIRKQPSNYPFSKFPEGDLLAHVRAHQPKYLGAVFAIIREWHRLGKPELDQAGHNFRPWAKKVGWVVENLLGTAPLMEGHGENQRQLANQNLTWLRDVGLTLMDAGAGGQELQAAKVLETLERRRPELLDAILSDTAASGDGDPGNKRLLAMGRKLAACFTGTEPIIVVETGEIRVTRTERLEQRGDGGGTTRHRVYKFEYARPQGIQAIPTLPILCRKDGAGAAVEQT